MSLSRIAKKLQRDELVLVPSNSLPSKQVAVVKHKHKGASSAALANKVYTIRQHVNMVKANINVSTGGVTYNNPTSSSTFAGSASANLTSDPMFACYFTVADLPQISTYMSLFDQYKINRITVTFGTTANNWNPQTASTNLNAPEYKLWYTVDYDDAAVISPLTSLMEYEAVKYHNMMKGDCSVSFVPHAAIAGYSGTFSGYANVKSPWIDMASNTVQHFGIKWGLPCPIASTYGMPSVSLTVTYDVSFRTVK